MARPEPTTRTEAEANFLADCQFAKIVNTPHGTGILIGGEVFTLNCPPDYPQKDSPGFTRLLVTALRRGPVSSDTSLPSSATLG